MPAKIENYLYVLSAIQQMQKEGTLPQKSTAVTTTITKLAQAIQRQESDVLIVAAILQKLQTDLALENIIFNNESAEKLKFLTDAIQFTIYTSLQHPDKFIQEQIINTNPDELQKPDKVVVLMKVLQQHHLTLARERREAKLQPKTKLSFDDITNKFKVAQKELSAIIEHNKHSQEVVTMAMAGQQTVMEAQRYIKNNRYYPISTMCIPGATLRLVKSPTELNMKEYAIISQNIKKAEGTFRLVSATLKLLGAAGVVAGITMALTGVGLFLGLGVMAFGALTGAAGVAMGSGKSSNLPSNTATTIDSVNQNINQYRFYNQQRAAFSKKGKTVDENEDVSAFALLFPRPTRLLK